MCNTNLTREQLVSILSDAQQLVQNARSALTLEVAYKGTKEPALFEFYEDECKAVHKRVDAILEAAGVELIGDYEKQSTEHIDFAICVDSRGFPEI